MSDRRIIVSRDADAWPTLAAGWIAERLRQAVEARGRANLTLAGGSTPRRVYECLAASPLSESVPWSAVSIFFGDERCVPPEHEESNFRMARTSLLEHVPIPDAQVYRMRVELEDRDAAAGEYAALLPDPLDLLLLGVGDDGHTASLFPGGAELGEKQRRVIAVRGAKPPPWRLTITPSVIAAAREVAVLACGSAKAEVVARAADANTSPTSLPIRLAQGATWILDPDAAAQLPDDLPTLQEA